MFRNADPSKLRGSLLEGNKDHLLNQARSDLTKQELHVESLNKCIGELQRQTEEQRLAIESQRRPTGGDFSERRSEETAWRIGGRMEDEPDAWTEQADEAMEEDGPKTKRMRIFGLEVNDDPDEEDARPEEGEWATRDVSGESTPAKSGRLVRKSRSS